eukprot:COSAG01_NODE_43373_length_430_cov_1.096677_1_plen_62_part_01
MIRCPETTTYRIHRTQYQPWNAVVVHNAHLTLIGTKLRLQIALWSAPELERRKNREKKIISR